MNIRQRKILQSAIDAKLELQNRTTTRYNRWADRLAIAAVMICINAAYAVVSSNDEFTAQHIAQAGEARR